VDEDDHHPHPLFPFAAVAPPPFDSVVVDLRVQAKTLEPEKILERAGRSTGREALTMPRQGSSWLKMPSLTTLWEMSVRSRRST
jgi:hypothetical protein